MSETLSPAARTHGRVIRAALIFFPVGTILFSIVSFGIWWYKKASVEERGYKYALALRREMDEAGLRRHQDILLDVMRQPDAEKIPAVAAYLESSMGAENMGYQVRRVRHQQDGIELANVDVELTGKQRPREIVLYLATYGDPSRTEQEARSIAVLMSLAHSVTGEAGTGTLRLCVSPAGLDPASLDRLLAAARERNERFMKVYVAGGLSEERAAAVRKAFREDETGTVFEFLPASADLPAALVGARALKAMLLKAAE